MANALTVTRTHRGTPGTLDGPRYQITTATGTTYALTKEFYAAGPSLFTWVLRGIHATVADTYQEFNTKTAALDWVTANSCEAPR